MSVVNMLCENAYASWNISPRYSTAVERHQAIKTLTFNCDNTPRQVARFPLDVGNHRRFEWKSI